MTTKTNEFDFTFFEHSIASGVKSDKEMADYLRKLADLIEISSMPEFKMNVTVENK